MSSPIGFVFNLHWFFGSINCSSLASAKSPGLFKALNQARVNRHFTNSNNICCFWMIEPVLLGIAWIVEAVPEKMIPTTIRQLDYLI